MPVRQIITRFTKYFVLAVTVLLNGMALAQIPTSGLIGAWPFTGNANDLSASANHGTLVTATPTVDRCGNANSAYYFNGSTSQIRTSLNGPVGNAPRAVSFWAKTTNTVSNSPRSSFHYGTSIGAADSWQVNWNYCSQGVGIDLSNQACIKGNICLENNAWHHIVISFNSAVSSVFSATDIYIDGVLQSALTCFTGGSTATVSTISGAPITMGKDANFSTRYFEGCLDDFYFYNRALTPTEVLQLYTVTPCMEPVQGNTLVCTGSTNVYSVTPYTNATYTWSLPGGWTGSSNSSVITTTAGGSGTILVTASSTCGLLPSFSLAVTAGGNPTVSIASTSNTICANQPATLSVLGAANYTWNTGAINSNIIVAPATTSVYTAVGQNTSGCSSLASFTQYVANNPTLSVSSTPILCSGASVTVSASGATSYTWLPANSNSSSFVVTPVSTYNYTLFGNQGLCTSSVTGLLVVPPALTLAIQSSTDSICLGNAISFSASVSGGAGPYSYSWSPAGLSSPTFTVALPNSGNYTGSVTVTDANNCILTGIKTVTFFSGVAISAPSIAICSNTLGNISASGAQTYTWQPGNQIAPTITVGPSGPFIYTVTGTSASGCTAAAVTSFTVKPTPLLNFTTFTITCGNLGSATVNASGGVGPYSYTWQPTTQTGSVASGLFPGIYTVTVEDNGSACIFTPTTNFSALVPLTGTVYGNFSNPCNSIPSATAGINLAGGSSSQTYNWITSTSVQTSSLGGPFGAGIHTISVTDNLTFCNVTHTFTVVEPPPIGIVFSTNSNSVCLGNQITASASITGGTPGYNIQWSNGVSQTTNTIIESSAGIYVYTLTAVDDNTCAVSNTLQLKFVPNPTVVVSDFSICPLQATTLTSSGATTYSWSNGVNVGSVSVNPSQTTNYTVVGRSLGCSDTAIAQVFVKPIPSGTITNNSPVCENSNLILSITGAQSYNWTGPNSFSSTQSTIVMASVQTSVSGQYTIQLTAANSCTASLTTNVLVNPKPIIGVNSATVCEGSPLILSGNYISNGGYLWISSGGTLATTQTFSLPSSSLSDAGTYTFVLSSAAGCTSSATSIVQVIPNFNASIQGKSDYCTGENIEMTVTGGANYFWNGPNNFLAVTPGFTIPVANPINTGIYELTVSVGPCVTVLTKSVTVWPLPVVNGSISTPVCENSQAQFSATGAQQLIWLGPSGISLSGANAQLTSTQFSNAGVYTLTGTDQHGCAASITGTLAVLPAPTSITKNYNVCIGSPITLTIAGADSYQWTGPLNFSSQNTVCVFQALQAAQAGTYQIVMTNSANCSSISNLVISAFALPLPSVSIAGNTRICAESGTKLFVSANNATHKWLQGVNVVATGDTLFLSPDKSIVPKIFYVVTTGSNGCEKIDSVQVTYLPPSAASIKHKPLQLCAPNCNVFFADSNLVKHATFSIDNYSVNARQITYCTNRAALNTVQAKLIDTSGCSVQRSLNFQTFESPVAEFYVSPAFPTAGIDQVRFFNASSGNNQKSWEWYINGDDSVFFHSPNPEILFNTSGQKLVTLIVTNEFGCSDTITKEIIIYDEFSLYIPNSFTPNGDNTNDDWLIFGTGIKTMELEIFNRWGELIFRSNDPFKGWNGFYNGKPAEAGTYAYKLVITAHSSSRKELTGHLNLLR